MEVYSREPKGDRPILAICYDFDKTLSPDDMQAQGFIQSLGYEVAQFWKESNKLAADNDMDQNLAYMYLMAKLSRGKFLFIRENLVKEGEKIKMFPGVETWFDRINQYGNDNGLEVEHYIISSGLKEMIEGTSIACKFKKIYASSFYYDENNEAAWPAQAVNYTNKTQFLFRIEKGVLDINDQGVNSYFNPDQYRIPFRNIVYIGDSDTDIPCMKLVNSYGGHSIGVYNSKTCDKSKVFRMMNENRIKYFSPADYTEGSQLETLIKQIIDRTVSNEILENKHNSCLNEMTKDLKSRSEEEIKKNELVDKLNESSSFRNTHSIIASLKSYKEWDEEQIEKLISTALTNVQVNSILTDSDVYDFYKMIAFQSNSKAAQALRKLLGL